MTTPVVMNPMHYWCAPNAATPDYVASHDLKHFIGYGMLTSWISHDTGYSEDLAYSDEDIKWLREGFLRCVEYADHYVRMGHLGDVDMGSQGTGITLYPKGYDRDAHPDEEPPDGSIEVEWRLERIDRDAVLIVLSFNNADYIGAAGDDIAIWCHRSCFNNRFRVARLIAQARMANGLLINNLTRRLAA